MLTGKTVVVGVTGGIAAYKAVEVVSRLRKHNAEVHVIMTKHATKLVAPLTFRTISGSPVIVDMFLEPRQWNVEHIALAEKADLFLVCPATANIIGKIASGIADDFLTTTILACVAPKVICPAMNHNMYDNPATKDNIRKLKDRGYLIEEPAWGRLASGAMGKGRLPEPEIIVQSVLGVLGKKLDFQGLRILVTAGPTREYLDPVRYISPPSTGKMGYAIAQAAAERGAEVILVTGPTDLVPPGGIKVRKVTGTKEMLEACLWEYHNVDVVIGAAAPSDFRPKRVSKEKIKKAKAELVLELEPTEDILATLGRDKGNRILVGFAAESENLVENASSKIKTKNLDFICANQVGLPDRGFSSETNEVTLIYPDGATKCLNLSHKKQIAHYILDNLKTVLTEKKT